MAKLYDKNGKLIEKLHFGGNGYEDYTIHGDDERRKRYIARHSATQDWRTINPGSLSRYILWEKKNIDEAIVAFGKRFGVKISANID